MIRPMLAANGRSTPAATPSQRVSLLRGARAALLALTCALACALAPAASAAGDPTVIVLSFDGVAHDALDAPDLDALARIQREGARAERLVPVFPSLTFPNHVSLATGAPPDVHGIVLNAFRDEKRGRFHYGNDASWIEAEPIWVAAERQGVRSAVYFWVGSETPWQGVSASYVMRPFDESVDESAKVAQILAWLDLPPPERPRLVLSWWHGTDKMGHRFGPKHPRLAAALRSQDHALAALLAGIDARGGWGDTTLLVVSDHGMAEIADSVDLGRMLRDAGIGCDAYAGGGVAQVWLDDPSRRDAALALLRAVPGVAVYRRDALPAAWRYRHPTRTGDLVALATPPVALVDGGSESSLLSRALRHFGIGLGGHGYDPARDDMAGIFVALGRGVPAGVRLGPVRALDVAPTVAGLLGIAPPKQSEGTPIAGIGGPPAKPAAEGGGG
jgi:arylsulfatase A-like enzyme